ncbi:PIN-like domain-containing protein [Pseudomonas viridiflava]|uniref:PIN-like domain-containing protein n=1 Tax=Pseudomonas viridiflava TaxID=33069 RepID=UPI000F0337DC|nr:PIN-like domain-containing protein [Pseudomonas viridiflava]
MTEKTKQITSLLNTHQDLDEETLNIMWEKAVFVFDANVLLDLYRLPQTAKNELLSVLENPEIKNRIWVSFQGMLEFLNNRHDTIGDQKNKFEMVRRKLQEAIAGYNSIFSTLTAELAKLKLTQKHSLIDPEQFISAENIKSGINFVNKFLENLNQLEKKQNDVHDRDDTKKHIVDLFDDKIGYGFSKEEINKIYEEGEKRYANDIPPGYMDKKKSNSYIVLDIEYKCKFGDLLFWHEVIRKAQTEKLECIILVTGDLKEDWWLEKRGKKLGPRKELLNEIYTKAPDLKFFHMYETSQFLRRVDEKSTFKISESTISQTENLTTDRRKFGRDEWVLIQDVFDVVATDSRSLLVSKDNSFTQLPPVNIPVFVIFDIINIIVDNVVKHASEKAITLSSVRYDNHLTVRFLNPFAGKNVTPITSYRATFNDFSDEGYSGLKKLRNLLAREDVGVKTIFENDSFLIEIFIPTSRFYIK